jgi:outer membrane protein
MTALLLALLLAAEAPSPRATGGGPEGTPLSLDEALVRARAHPRIAQASAAAAQASARSREVFAGFLPAASASVAYGRQSGSAAGRTVDGSSPLYAASVNAQVPIWDFGRTLEGVRSARAAAGAALSDLDAARAEQAFQVTQAYFGVLAAEALVAVADDTIVQMQKHLALAQAQLDVGRRTRFDVTRAEVDLANARIQKIQADNGVATARAALAAAIGEDLAGARLVEPAGEDRPDPRPADAVAAALRARPEIVALDRRVAAAEASTAAVRDAWYPTFAASGQVTWQDNSFPLHHSWQVLGTLSWPFLNGGADVARLAEAAAALDVARATRDAEALQVKVEAEQAALAVIEARARRDVSKVLVAQATENLDLAEGRYQAGVGSIVDLADAQAALTSARAGAIRAVFDLATARARLVRAVGEP